MKKLLTISALMCISFAVLADNIELSDQLIARYKAGQEKGMLKNATTHDHLWLTPVLRDAFLHWDELTPEAKVVFKQFAGRPTFSGTEKTATSGIFVFHYTTNSGQSDEDVNPTDANANSIPDYVDKMMGKFNEMYDLYHATAGLNTPPSDGDNKYDIYISGYEAGEGVYGYVAGEDQIGDNPSSSGLTEVDAATSYMVMRNNYSGFGDEDIAMSVTAAHEYMHAVQMAYAVSMDAWFMESSATWSEDYAYPGYDDNFQYLTGSLGAPDVAINLEDGEAPDYDGHWYSSWIFIQYLTEHTNTGIIKNIYERCVTQYAINAIDSELQANHSSSLATLFGQFIVANILMTSNASFAPYTYKRAADYKAYMDNNGGIPYETGTSAFNYAGSNAVWDSKTNGNNQLMRLSADYIKLTANQNFKIIFSPTTPSENLDMILIKSNSTSAQVVETNSSGEINVTDQATWTKFVVIVGRLDIAVKDVAPADYKVYATTADAVKAENIDLQGVSIYPVPANDFITVSVTSADLKHLEIVDVTGNVLHTQALTNPTVNIADLANGVYFLKVYENNQVTETRKIIVSH